MNSISSYNPAFPLSSSFPERYQNFSELQATRVSVSESQNKDITIFTEEGDKVAISTDQQYQAQSLTYEGLKQSITSADFQGHSISKESLAMFRGEAFESEISKNISISVDGDLNKQELKDIKKAIKGIDKIMRNLLYGGDIVDVTAITAKAAEIGDLSTIAGFEANYRYEKSVVLEKATVKESTTYSRQGLPETSPLTKNNHFDQLKTIIDEMVNIVKESRIKPSRFQNPIQKLFSDYKNNLTENELQNGYEIRMAELIENRLLKSLSEKFSGFSFRN